MGPPIVEQYLTRLEQLAKTRKYLKFGPAGANNPVLMQAVAHNIKCLSYYAKGPISDYIDRLVNLSVAFEDPCGTNIDFLPSEVTDEFDAIIEARVNVQADSQSWNDAYLHLPGWSALHTVIPAPYKRTRKLVEWIITAGLEREETKAKDEADSLVREAEETAAAKNVGVKRA